MTPCPRCGAGTSDVVADTCGYPPGLCLACGCAWRDGEAAGYEAAVRDFWRGVCEQKAQAMDRLFASDSRRAADDRLSGHRHAAASALRDALHARDQAAQLRAWAREGA